MSIYYGFEINVTNAFSGNEKGYVEGSVKYLRNKIFAENYKFSSEEAAIEYMESQLIFISIKLRKNLNNDEESQFENGNDENEKFENKNSKTTNYSNIDLSRLKIENNDLVGWIKIDDTNISYPVMQNGTYYLKRNFYKKYSEYGTPFLQENCNVATSDNLVTYGHHMNNKTMYSAIDNYKNYDFYRNHKYIKFYTIEDGQTKECLYEVCFVFKTISTGEGYKYYSYTNFYDIDEYNEFVSGCKNIQLYGTGVQTKYGDKFITLSTCEYSQKNGRMVIVGRKI